MRLNDPILLWGGMKVYEPFIHRDPLRIPRRPVQLVKSIKASLMDPAMHAVVSETNENYIAVAKYATCSRHICDPCHQQMADAVNPIHLI